MPSVSLPSGISSHMTFLNLSLFSALWITLFLCIPRHNFHFHTYVFCILYAVSCNLSYNSESFVSFKNSRQSKYCHTPQWEINQGISALAKTKDFHLPWWENPVFCLSTGMSCTEVHSTLGKHTRYNCSYCVNS